MCGPWAGAVMGGVQMYQQSQAAQASAEFNSAVMDRNREIALRAEKDSVLYGAGAGSSAVEAGSRMISKARSVSAASGVDVGSEGVLSILETTRETAALDAATIRNNALREALGFSTQASSFAAQSRLSQMQGRYQQNAIMLGGFSNIYSQFNRYGSTVLTEPTSSSYTPQGSPDGAGYGAGWGWDPSQYGVDMAKGSE